MGVRAPLGSGHTWRLVGTVLGSGWSFRGNPHIVTGWDMEVLMPMLADMEGPRMAAVQWDPGKGSQPRACQWWEKGEATITDTACSLGETAHLGMNLAV